MIVVVFGSAYSGGAAGPLSGQRLQDVYGSLTLYDLRLALLDRCFRLCFLRQSGV
jgi:hypothetical protein